MPTEASSQQFSTAALAVRIRRRATSVLHRRFRETVQKACPLNEALILLRHLRPGQIEAAEWCHQTLVKEAGRDLHHIGFPPDYFDLINLTFTFLDLSGRWYTHGRWSTRGTFFAHLDKATA